MNYDRYFRVTLKIFTPRSQTLWVYHSHHYILQYIEGNKERVDAHLSLLNENHNLRSFTISLRRIVFLRFSELFVCEFTSATASEKMFNENLIFQLKKLRKLKKSWFGWLGRILYTNSIWSILDQLSEIYKYLLLPDRQEILKKEEVLN